MCTRLAAEDLEGEMAGISLSADLVSGWTGFGLRVGFGLTEKVAFDVSCAPPAISSLPSDDWERTLVPPPLKMVK